MNELTGTLLKDSPGQGYWRQQLDHIALHLKSYTRENAVFQGAIAQPVMGEVVSAQFRRDGDEVILTVTLTDKSSKKNGGLTSKLGQSMTLKESLGLQNVPLDPKNGSVSKNNKTKGSLDSAKVLPENGGKATLRTMMSGDISASSRVLLAELGEQGKARKDVVLGLLDAEADPNAITKDHHFRPLFIAALHGHNEIIPVLVAGGADVNGRVHKGETALHAAVRAAKKSQECIVELLALHADPNLKNADGETPCALAATLRKKELVAFFGIQLARPMLSQFSKSTL